MSALTQLSPHIQPPKTAADMQQAQRLFHSRGHAYPDFQHVTIDWLPPVTLITLLRLATGCS